MEMGGFESVCVLLIVYSFVFVHSAPYSSYEFRFHIKKKKKRCASPNTQTLRGLHTSQ